LDDLDLVLIAPSGNEYYGNTFSRDGKKSLANPPAKDPRLNNNVVERVIIQRRRNTLALRQGM